MPSSTDANQVIDAEYNRLNAKKKSIDDALSAQKRAIWLNESYRKRYSRYTRIVMIISAVFVIYLGVLAFRKYLPSYPEWISDVLLIIVFSGGAVLCVNILVEIAGRSTTNYDELDLPPYETVTTESS
jgi:preprotein translocase subunit SecE